MRNNSNSSFLSKFGRGIKQAARWVAKLFGYKANTLFGRILWYVFATSACIIALFLAVALVSSFRNEMAWRELEKLHSSSEYLHDYSNQSLSTDVVYHEAYNGDGYVYNKRLGQRTLTGVTWVCESEDADHLAFFSNGKKRGYFDRFTGELVIPAKFEKAWVFSEGLACVMLDGKLGFVDHDGNMLIENTFDYTPYIGSYCFHSGLCLMSDDNGKMGFIDKRGKWVVNPIYSYVNRTEKGYWIVEDTSYMRGLLNENGQVVIPCEYEYIYFGWQDEYISVRTRDHIDQVFDKEGRLVNAFDYQDVEWIEYPISGNDDSWDQQMAHSDCMRYTTSDYHYGIMDRNCRRITLPIYTEITALGPDRFFCDGPMGSVILDNKGNVVQ